MLGKVMKYEFKATARDFLPVYLVTIILAIICGFAFNTGSEGVSGLLSVLLVMLLFALFTAMWIITLVTIIRRFWTNLLGREGYLMHTLPVKPWQHVMGRLFTSTIWCVCGVVFTVVAFLLMSYAPVQATLQSGLADGFRQLIQYLHENDLTGRVILGTAELLANALLSCLSMILMIYFSMAVGQLVNRHRALLSVGAFIGVIIVLSTLSSLLGRVVDAASGSYLLGNILQMAPSLMEDMQASLIWQLAENLVLSVAFFFGTEVLLRRRLNLQ